MLLLIAIGFYMAGVAATAIQVNNVTGWVEWTIIFCVNGFLGYALFRYKETH